MPNLTSFKWLVWIGLYAVPVLVLPSMVSRAWAQQHGSKVDVRPKQLFDKGELGLISPVLMSSVIWDLLQSQFTPYTIALGSILLALCGIMSVNVWVEAYCRRSSGERWTPARAWRDSRSLALMVFGMAAVIEIILDHFARAVGQ